MPKKMSMSDSADNHSGHGRMSLVATASLVLSLAAQASAFHSGVRETFSMDPLISSRLGSNRISKSTRSMPLTSMKYANDATSADAGAGWWNTIFQPRKTDEQESVDEYLEFLDRRYNRLRSSNDDGDAKPLSALGWLVNGSPKRNDVRAAAQQQEDSLYVLGVAGLASEKLLQKHQLAPPAPQTTPKPASTPAPKIIDVVPEKETASTRFIKKVLVPVIRRYVILQRAKTVFVDTQLQKARSFAVASVKILAKSLVQGPIMTARAFLDIGGGKESLAMTIAAVSTVLLLLRPILQAVAESSAVGGTVSP